MHSMNKLSETIKFVKFAGIISVFIHIVFIVYFSFTYGQSGNSEAGYLGMIFVPIIMLAVIGINGITFFAIITAYFLLMKYKEEDKPSYENKLMNVQRYGIYAPLACLFFMFVLSCVR